MMKLFLPVLFYLFPFSLFSQITFQKVYGGVHDDEGVFATQTNDGGYAVAGSTKSYTSGDADFYLVKTNAQGDTLWSHSYGTSRYESMFAAIETSDGGFILGGDVGEDTTTCIYIVKTDNNGAVAWSFVYHIYAYDDVASIMQTADGGYLVSGLNQTVQTASPTISPFLLKLTASGNVAWIQQYLINGWEIIRSSVHEYPGGGFVMAGMVLTSSGFNEFVMRTTSTGALMWAKRFAGGLNLYGMDCWLNPNGDITLLGSFDSGTGNQIHLVKINSLTNVVWSMTYTITGADIFPRAFTADAYGNLYVAANVSSTVTTGAALKFNAVGQLQWARSYGPNSNFSSIHLAVDGGLVLGGTIAYATTSADSGSLYIVKTDANGNSPCCQSLVCNASMQPLTSTFFTFPAVSVCNRFSVSTEMKSGCMTADGCTVGISEPAILKTSSPYPNPFTSSATIEIPGLDLQGPHEFQLLNMHGSVVREFSFTGNSVLVNRNDLPAGIYFYRIIREGEIVSTGKLIAE